MMVGISISLGLRMLAEIDRLTTEMKFLHKEKLEEMKRSIITHKHDVSTGMVYSLYE